MSLLTPKVDFDILDTYDLRVLRIIDMSDWKHLINETTYISIITPGRTKEVLQYFKKDKINLFNSNTLDLGLTDFEGGLVALPDGIYKIRVFVDGDNSFCKEVHYLRTVNLMLELDKALIAMDLCSCSEEDKNIEVYAKAELLIHSAHANTRDGNINQAICEYEKAKVLLEELRGCGK